MTCNTPSHAPTSLWIKMEAYSTWALPFHQPGHTAHLITSKANEAAACWAVVQQKHALLQCSDTVCLFPLSRSTMVALFDACIVPQLHLPIIFENSYNRVIWHTSSVYVELLPAFLTVSSWHVQSEALVVPWLSVPALLSTSVCCRS